MSDEIVVSQPQTSVHLVARNPSEMAQAKSSLEQFLKLKIQQCEAEASDLWEAYEEAQRHKWKSSTLRNHYNLAIRRSHFYTKARMAVEAGYTLVPNFPVDVFAVRVKRETPLQDQATSTSSRRQAINNAKNLEADALPAEAGKYVSDMPAGVAGSFKERDKNDKEITKYFFITTEYQDIAFPMEAARVEVMSATAEAMALRVFDQIGICPQTRKGDPLLIGKILGPKRGYQQKEISFLIAWHLDLRTL